ncbi:hypothetical protein ACEWB5_16200 [Citrobacter koseri]|uniref:hypothetical protein n=1 Tax=Citrobacter koseri TaxID=545 RepID=UPI003988ABE1
MKSTVETKICELVKSGHERAAELKGSFEAINACSVAQLISDLATQLEVQFARSNALAAKLSMINDLMGAAEQANKLAQEATEKLVQERDALASLDAEVVADVVAWSSQNEERTCDVRLRRHDINPGPLYADPPAPPAPVSVPDFDALTKCIVQRLVDYGAADDDAIGSAEEFVYNACRAAMLQGKG